MPTDRNPVVWYEGMNLDPHHFQQWDRSHRHAGRRRLEAACPHGWGFTELQVDEERLRNGDVVLTRCVGFFPDGTALEIPAVDPAPEPRNVRHSFGPTGETLRVFLAVPATSANGREQSSPEDCASPARHRTDTVIVPDETPGGEDRPVEVARLNTQIRLGGEALASFVALPIAAVERKPDGTFRQSDTFVPPVLRVGASARIGRLVERLLERLVDWQRMLRDRLATGRRRRDVTPPDALALALLQAVARAVPVLEHHHRSGSAHPVDLYLSLAQLASHLAAFAPPPAPGDPETDAPIPAYDHDDLSSVFTLLVERLHGFLSEALPPSPCDPVRLVRERDHLFTARLSEEQLASRRLYLSVRSDAAGREPPDELADLLRIASPQTIDPVLKSYTRALPVRTLPAGPAGAPLDPEARYFQLVQAGPFWEAIEDAGAIAIFVPHSPGELDLQLLAVTGP
jgi:type VI secretion system protein ImpJ